MKDEAGEVVLFSLVHSAHLHRQPVVLVYFLWIDFDFDFDFDFVLFLFLNLFQGFLLYFKEMVVKHSTSNMKLQKKFFF